MMAGFNYSRQELESKLTSIVGETLGDIDVNHAFDKTINNPKVTGIAGDVIEKSVLGYPSNSDQEPDITVDGVPTEVKTTGLRYTKKAIKKGKPKKTDFEAKEPMSITAVSPEKIVNETFDNSNFWHKLEHMLLVYYHYNSPTPVKSWDYKDFTIEGFDFHEFSTEDREILKNDWLLVQRFIKDAQENYPDPTIRYPYLGSELRKNLMFIDTAPKWPKRPRFRLKRSTVTAMVQDHFSKVKYDELPENYSSFADIDRKLAQITREYKGKTIAEICEQLDIPEENMKNKAISGVIVSKMFGGRSGKINKIKVFKDASLILKTLTQTTKGTRTEDTKLFNIDFQELDHNSEFEDSQFFNYFSEHQFLVIVFEEPDNSKRLADNVFQGFKRLSFSDEWINTYVKRAWDHTRNLIVNKELEEKPVFSKKTGKPITNKNGVQRTKLNFIKSSDNPVFVRGSGVDSSIKPLKIQGISMYHQYLWVSGKQINTMLNKEEFI